MADFVRKDTSFSCPHCGKRLQQISVNESAHFFTCEDSDPLVQKIEDSSCDFRSPYIFVAASETEQFDTMLERIRTDVLQMFRWKPVEQVSGVRRINVGGSSSPEEEPAKAVKATKKKVTS